LQYGAVGAALAAALISVKAISDYINDTVDGAKRWALIADENSLLWGTIRDAVGNTFFNMLDLVDVKADDDSIWGSIQTGIFQVGLNSVTAGLYSIIIQNLGDLVWFTQPHQKDYCRICTAC